MAFCRLVFPLLVLSVVSCYASNVPVYIWGDLPETGVRESSLSTVSEDGFRDGLIRDLKKDQVVIVFYEKQLSTEDLALKIDNGKTAFPYLHSQIGSSEYLSSVNNPLSVLEDLDDVATKFISLEDAREKETRPQLLSRHDDFIRRTMSQMREKYENVVGVYTARDPSWYIPEIHSRVRRDVARNTTYPGLSGLLLNVVSLSVISSNESTALTTLTSSSSEFNTTTMNTTLNFENSTSITLNFYLSGGYWFFESVSLSISSLTERLLPVDEEIYALEDFSYRCAQTIQFSSVNESRQYSVSFEDLKIQPFFEATNSSTEFGDSFNCVGFFTAPIWAGLFVTFILLFITFFGITMMMDIRTMDRFDDPKGKTITINAGE